MGQHLSYSGSKKVKGGSKLRNVATTPGKGNRPESAMIVAPMTDRLPHRGVVTGQGCRRPTNCPFESKNGRFLDANTISPRQSLRSNRKRTLLDLNKHDVSDANSSSCCDDSESGCPSTENLSVLDYYSSNLEDLLPSKLEHKILSIIFEEIKQSAEFIAWKGVESMFSKMPNVAKRFSSSPNRPIKHGDSWELMGQGIVLLGSLEKAMTLTKHPRRFRKYIAELVKSHERYGVPINELMTALDIFHSLIASYAFEKSHCVEYMDVCSALNRFFSSIQHELHVQGNKPQRHQHSPYDAGVCALVLPLNRAKSWSNITKRVSNDAPSFVNQMSVDSSQF